jgi:hypothetical protein
MTLPYTAPRRRESATPAGNAKESINHTRPIVEPAQRQHLDVRIKIGPQIADHPLLERVVQE